MKGRMFMKILQVNNGKAEYLTKSGNYATIIDITKEDVYYLINTILDNEIEIDIENDTDKKILNDVEKVIYTNIRLELEKIVEKKDTLNSSVNDLFKEAYATYKEDIKEEIIASEMTMKTKEINEVDSKELEKVTSA